MPGFIPERFNLARYCLGAGAPRDPDRTGLIVASDTGPDAERWRFSELDLAVRSFASGLLAAGIAPGDRLLIRLPNTSDYPLLFFGAIAAGILPIPASGQLTEAEAEFLLRDSGAVAVAGGPPFAGARHFDVAAVARLRAAPPLAGYADTAAEDPAYLIYTSGTSSRPKGVLHAHRSVLGRRPMLAGWYGMTSADTMLHAGAFNWSFTLGAGLTDPWSAGATAVVNTGPRDPAVWPKLIAAHGATLFAAVPGIYRQILKHAEFSAADLATLRHGLSAGEALPPAILTAWRERTGLELYEALGMSECSTFVSNRPGMAVKPGSPGRPQEGRRVAVIPVESGTTPLPPGETGLLAIHRSEPGLMLGYWRRPKEDAAVTREDWFIGGDLAAFDTDGYLWHRGRADDLMNAGGYRVSPAEVEEALAGAPGVAELAVAEHRVRADVSVIAAFVVPADGAAPDRDAILALAETRLAAYKRPREIFVLEALPRTANGKVMRRALSSLVRAPADV